MKFVADEGVDRQIVARLRGESHRIWYVAELEPGIPDDAVLDLAIRETALLLTAGKDFGELIFRQGRLAPGVVLVRLAGLSSLAKAEVVASTIKDHEAELEGAFAAITSAAIRIRRLSG